MVIRAKGKEEEEKLDEAIKDRDLPTAIAIAMSFSTKEERARHLEKVVRYFLPFLEKNPTAFQEVKEIIRTELYSNLPWILKKNGFSEEEVKEAAKIACYCLYQIKNYNAVLTIAKEYGVCEDLVKKIYEKNYNYMRELGEISSGFRGSSIAFDIALEGNLGKEAIKEVALRAFADALGHGDFERAQKILQLSADITEEELNVTTNTLKKAFGEKLREE
jgi:hypothetical protein